MIDDNLNIVLCNDAELTNELKRKRYKNILQLNYDKNDENTKVFIGLPKLVLQVQHLPDNIKDLLEIAAYVYAADRSTSRGSNESVEYQKWSRSFHFIIKVRDFDFWNKPLVKESLSASLLFMSGDKSFKFTFQKGRISSPEHLFDSPEFKISTSKATDIILFSGGLDSLAGILKILKTTNNDVCLVSHKSNHPIINNTQKNILEKLNKEYPNRLKHYQFKCHLKKVRGIDETQRTRSFLYSSTALALSFAYEINNFSFYENGITSINFLERQDLMNSRASRTTHPKTLGLLTKFFINFIPGFKINHPFLFNTKTDIVELFQQYNSKNIIRDTISCSKTFQTKGESRHCGGCSQCIDRKFAIYSSSLDEYDDALGLYCIDFITEDIVGEIKNSLLDYVRLALEFNEMNIENFYLKRIEELSELEEYIDGVDEDEKISKVYTLCKKHGAQIEESIIKMRDKFDKPLTNKYLGANCLLKLISKEEHRKTPIQRLVKQINSKLINSIPTIFKTNTPINENDFNDKVNGLLTSESENYQREFPTISFALAKTIPDHSIKNGKYTSDLLIESKYIRGKKSISAITDELASDIVKYGKDNHILFILYDPQRRINNDEKFREDFELNYNCTVSIIR